jgi:uncharacterized membrane protein
MSETRQLPGAGDYGLLLLLAAIWGSSFVFIKVGVAEVPPVTLTAVRLVLAAVFLLLVMVVSGKRLPSDRQMWTMMAATALIGNALPFALIAWGQQGIPSNTSAILMGIMPLITIVVAHFFTTDETHQCAQGGRHGDRLHGAGGAGRAGGAERADGKSHQPACAAWALQPATGSMRCWSGA